MGEIKDYFRKQRERHVVCVLHFGTGGTFPIPFMVPKVHWLPPHRWAERHPDKSLASVINTPNFEIMMFCLFAFPS